MNIVGLGDATWLPAPLRSNARSEIKPELSMEDLLSFNAGGSYEASEGYVALDAKLQNFEKGKVANRLFFLSVPPTVFGAVSTQISANARAPDGGFTHLIIEKPFGKDSATFDELNACTSSLFEESQLYRIDHYLGKEVVLNLMTLRFQINLRADLEQRSCRVN